MCQYFDEQRGVRCDKRDIRIIQVLRNSSNERIEREDCRFFSGTPLPAGLYAFCPQHLCQVVVEHGLRPDNSKCFDLFPCRVESCPRYGIFGYWCDIHVEHHPPLPEPKPRPPQERRPPVPQAEPVPQEQHAPAHRKSKRRRWYRPARVKKDAAKIGDSADFPIHGIAMRTACPNLERMENWDRWRYDGYLSDRLGVH